MELLYPAESFFDDIAAAFGCFALLSIIMVRSVKYGEVARWLGEGGGSE